MTPASGGHEATCEETVDAKLRLDTQKLLDHAAALSSAIDTANAAGWALRTEWLPFMQDVDNLALGLDKLGDGSLAKARRVRDAKERSTPSRTTSNADDLRVRELPVAAPKEPKRYATLLEELRAIPDYQPLLVLDTHMGITLQTSTPSNVRRSFFKDMSFEEFPVKLHIFVHGGPHPSNAYVWRIGLPLDLARDSAAQAHAVTHAPAHSSRAMLRDFFDRFASVGNSRLDCVPSTAIYCQISCQLTMPSRKRSTSAASNSSLPRMTSTRLSSLISVRSTGLRAPGSRASGLSWVSTVLAA